MIHMHIGNAMECLACLLSLMILRRHYSTDLHCYDVMQEQFPQMFATFNVLLIVAKHTAWEDSSEERWVGQDTLSLLKTMKLNLHDFDWCTLRSQEILATTKHLGGKLAYALAIAYFGSRVFLTGLLEKAREHPDAHRKIVKQLVTSVIAANGPLGYQLFSLSFSPNRIMFREARGKPTRRVRRFITKQYRIYAKKVVRLQAFKAGRACSRRHVASRLGRAIGSFRGKNVWELLARAGITAPCFGRGRCQRSIRRTGYPQNHPPGLPKNIPAGHPKTCPRVP